MFRPCSRLQTNHPGFRSWADESQCTYVAQSSPVQALHRQNGQGMAQFEFLEWQENGTTATVWLNRPPANSVNQAMYVEMKEFFDNVDVHLPEARVLVLAGRGKHFCGGNDLEEFKTLDPENSPRRMKQVR